MIEMTIQKAKELYTKHDNFTRYVVCTAGKERVPLYLSKTMEDAKEVIESYAKNYGVFRIIVDLETMNIFGS